MPARLRLITIITLTALAPIAAGQAVPTKPPVTPPPTSQPAAPPTSQPTSQPGTQPKTVRFIRKADQLARRIGLAHGAQAWRGHSAIEADLRVTFGDDTLLEGTLLYDHKTNRVRLEGRDGVTMVFDGERAWISPPTELPIPPRFHLLTWPYFLAAPFKLHDPGTKRSDMMLRSLNGKLCESFRLTFDGGVGDSPDDWYIIYAEPGGSSRMAGMAYIVTYGGLSREAAEGEPHGVVYSDFRVVDDVTIAHRWTFRQWSDDRGFADVIGRAELSNVHFVVPNDHAFTPPNDAEEDPLPGR